MQCDAKSRPPRVALSSGSIGWLKNRVCVHYKSRRQLRADKT